MILNDYGTIACNEWEKLPDRFVNFKLDVFQIMPNHMHGIIALKPEGATLAVAKNDDNNQYDGNVQHGNTNIAGASPVPAVPDIVGAYKSLVANRCLKIYKSHNETMGKLWQRNYYERIIRNHQSYENISKYILNNPAKWQEDKFHEE